ncbi:hypothetical protein [Mitsuaria sp. 7]|jgi:hypothetical protein|uniref:hypothetical protein n=1 Tax=Mitsuaria sp. 7 TaxID=1658665 RepID=UPI0007DDE020|nr:hypothetical protein [Mitsuaria sp. 7]ANH70969.1 hypothetical protein ABE85_25915 [Mitsuaria sp. 7]
MTEINSTQRLLRTALTSSNRLAEEMQRIGPADLERAIAIKQKIQTDNVSMNTAIQMHRSIERKILNEQR